LPAAAAAAEPSLPEVAKVRAEAAAAGFPSQLVSEAEFRELEAKNPRFKFLVTCTRLTPEDPWTGRRGRVTPEWVKSFVDDPANTVFYACGTNDMVNAVEHLVLHDLGLPKEQMKLEKWG
jgi:NAD(P)H-flavin reductase